MAGILEALAVKEDGEDPLVATVRRQVTIGSESVFSMLMMHGVEFDADKVTRTYPKDKDGHDVAPKAFLERARALSARMMSFLADRNAKRAAAKARKRSASGAPSSKAAVFRRRLADELGTFVIDCALSLWCLWPTSEYCLL
jgi:hypothetical protein